MMCLDVVRPHQTMGKPSKHPIADIQAIKCYFTMIDLIFVIMRMEMLWVAIADGLKTNRDVYKTGGYATTSPALSRKDRSKICANQDFISIEADLDKIDLLKDAGWSAVK